MTSAPRILFVADPPAALAVLATVRVGGKLQAQLAPSADALRDALADPAAGAWQGVVFVPGGPVEEVEVAVYVPDGVPLFVVGDEVPLLLTETAARAISHDALSELLPRLAAASPPASVEPPPVPAETTATQPPEFEAAATLEAAPSEAAPSSTEDPAESAPASAEAGTVPCEPDLLDEPVVASDLLFETPVPGLAGVPSVRPEPLPGLTFEASESGPLTAGGSLNRLASLADHLPIGLYRSTPDGHILYANPALLHLIGVDSMSALASLDVRADLGYPREAFVREMEQTGKVRNLVQFWTRHDGTRIATRENARILRDGHGGVLYYEGTMEDVTAEQAARSEEQAVSRQHRAVAAFASAASLAEDSSVIYRAAVGALLDATDAAWACLMTWEDGRNCVAAASGSMTGALARVVGEGGALLRAVPSDGPSVANEPANLGASAALAGALADAGAFPFGSVPVRKAGGAPGALVWGQEEGRIEPTEVRAAESLAWHVGAHLDRAEALRDLRDTEASLAVIADHTPHVLYRLRYTPDGPDFDYLSPAVEDLVGLPLDEIEARGGIDSFVADRNVLEGDGLGVGPVEGAASYHAVYRMSTAGGEQWVENKARPWYDGPGPAVGLVGVLQDVTECKLREERLANSAQTALVRQRALVDLAHLDGSEAFGAPAAAIAAATMGATDMSFWSVDSSQTAQAIYAPRPARDVPFGGAWQGVVSHVLRHRALAIADLDADPRVAELGLQPIVEAFALRALLVAPIRRDGRVVGLIAVHRTDGPHEWDAGETEFAAAVADAVALALERQDREQAVAALTEAREAAEAGRDAAERHNRLRASFLGNMSHEIRTPLTGILGFADLLAAEVAEPQREFVSLIERNGRRLLDTLNSVLDLSQLESGEYRTAPRAARLAPAVEAAAGPAAALAQERGLRFDFDLDPTVAAVIDASAFRQAVSHLVGNAVKFTEAGGVTVTVEGTAAEAVVRVADTGAGISPAFMPNAADAFRQEDFGHARRHEGAGLGLTVADRLVDLLGGRLELASEQPGGTVATLRFPRVPAPARLGPATPAPALVPAFGDGNAAPAETIAVQETVPVREPAPSWEPALGDGLSSPDIDVVPAAPPVLATAPADLLGDPFDFSFLDASDSPPETPMFDFRFGRSDSAPPDAGTSSGRRPAPAPPSAPAFPPAPAPPSARPAASPAPAPPTLRPDETVMIVRNRPDPGQPEPGPSIPEVAPPETAEVVAETGDGRPSVLVVEDNEDTRMLLERILRSTYDVVAAGDARSALLAMNQRRFSGLVLDINLGGKETGADVLRIARSLPRYDDVFAIALTAYALPGDRERLLASGFDAYISKPFTRQSLMESLAAGIAG